MSTRLPDPHRALSFESAGNRMELEALRQEVAALRLGNALALRHLSMGAILPAELALKAAAKTREGR